MEPIPSTLWTDQHTIIDLPILTAKCTRKVSKHLSRYNYTLLPSLLPYSPTSHSTPLSANSTVYPVFHSIFYSNFSRTHTIFLAAIFLVDVPTFFSQAAKHAHWRDAMAKKISTLEVNHN